MDTEKIERVVNQFPGYTVSDLGLLHLCSLGDIWMPLLKLKARHLIEWDRAGRLLITGRGAELLVNVELATRENVDFSRFESLSQAMWDNYPSMLQPSTGRPVRGSVGDVAMRLRILPPEYNIESYSDEDILAAEKRYLESLGGDYAFLLTLPDFIYQVKDGVAKSRLCEWLESDTKATAPKRQALLTL